jgi:hypothetical protein
MPENIKVAAHRGGYNSVNCSARQPPGHNSDAANVYSRSIDFFHGTGESQLKSVHRSRALLIAVLPLALASAVPQAQQPLAAPASYSVRGTVINSVTGQPVARALVSLAQDEAMLTDSNGQFSFDNVAAGGYSVSVGKPGFQGRGGAMGGMIRGNSFHPLRPGPPQRIQVGPDTPSVTLIIMPLATIAGHVTLSTADPADGIRIEAFGRRIEDGRPRWSLAGMSRTRSDGSFRIANLEPGSYRLSTTASLDGPGGGLDSRKPVWGYPSLYYPGTTDVSGAGLLAVGAGQQVEADITLVRQQFFPVTAVVHRSSDTPANFEILDSGGRETGLFARLNRQDGTVHSAIPNGTWTLEAHAFGKSTEWGSTTFQVNGAPVTFAISLQPIAHIPVIIRRDFSNSDTAQPAGAGAGMGIELTNADEMRSAGGGGMTQSENGGSSEWELRMSEAGRYWVKADAFPPAYISSVTSGGVDLGSNPLVVVPGSTAPAVEVTLRDDGGTISGMVSSQEAGTTSPNAAGEPLQVWVYAIPLFSTATTLRNVMANSDGHFSFYTVVPGSYRVVACDAQQEIDFHSPEGLAAWAGKGQTVTVDPGGTVSVQLDVTHIAAEAAR